MLCTLFIYVHYLLQAAALLEVVSGFINKKKEKRSEIPMEAVEVEITKFLEMLVTHVELRANNAVELLKVLQCSKLLSKKYRKIVTNMVSFQKLDHVYGIHMMILQINTRGMTEIKQLKLAQICILFKSLPIWKYSVCIHCV